MKRTAGIALGHVLAAGLLPAQQTWIVNQNGTGNFTDLAPAIQAASPGDTLLVLGGGTYGSYAVDKPLHILGDPQQRPFIDVLAHPFGVTGQMASFRHLDIHQLTVRHPTTIEDIDCYALLVDATTSILESSFGGSTSTYPAVAVYGGDIVLHGCTVLGNAAWHIQTLGCHHIGGDAFWMSGGNAVISDCTIEGSDSQWLICSIPGWSPPGPAVDAYGGTARITHSTLRGGADQNGVRWDPIVVGGGGMVFRDPTSVTTVPLSSVGSLAFYPATNAASAPPGGTIPCELSTGPNLPAVLVAGLGLRDPVSTPYGEAWIDPAANVILRIGFTDGSGRLQSLIVLPASAPRSLPITVQGLAVPGAAGNLVVGAPVVVQVL